MAPNTHICFLPGTPTQSPKKYYPSLIHSISTRNKKWAVTFIRAICVSPKINSYPHKNGNEYKVSDLHELVLFHIPHPCCSLGRGFTRYIILRLSFVEGYILYGFRFQPTWQFQVRDTFRGLLLWPLLTRRRRGTSADMVVQVCRLDNKHIIWGCIINLSTLRLLTEEDGARRGMKSLPHIIIIVVVKAPTNIRLLISCGTRCFGSSEAVVAV